MKKFLKSIFIMSLMIVMMFFIAGCEKKPELTADYESPTAAVAAFNSGVDMKGKTVLVTATMDSASGVIYKAPDITYNANILVTLVMEEATQGNLLTPEQANAMLSPDDPLLHVKEGETVVVKIDTMYSINQYQYTIFGTFVEKSE